MSNDVRNIIGLLATQESIESLINPEEDERIDDQ
jgi:hypothetical protein